MATLPQLAARSLRKLGVALVGDAERPPTAPPVSADEVVSRVLRELGIVINDSDRPAALPPVDGQEIAARSLRAVGVNPAGETSFALTGAIFTYEQIADQALIKLGVIAADEAPNGYDHGIASSRALDVHDQLASLGYVAWGIAQIPAYVAEAYIIMTANLLAPAFGRPATQEAFNAAQEMVRRAALSGRYGQNLAEAKASAVHEHLNANGLVSWPLGAVPLAYAEDYVAMTAFLLAPIMGKPGEKAAWDAAEANLRRFAVIRNARVRALEFVRGVQAELNASGLIAWDDNHIPLALADAMASMVANQLGPQFGKEFNPQTYAAAEQRVWRVSMGGPAGQKLAEQKIRAVQAYLEGRGIARWTIYDVPLHVEEQLVMMAAVWLAPECKQSADPSWWPASERALLQMVSLPTDYSPVVGSFF